MIRPTDRSNTPWIPPRATVAAIAAFVLLAAALPRGGHLQATAPPAPPPDGPPPLHTVFPNWPQTPPLAALVLSGQTYGYLQPCGCSRPQLGGLERRAQLVAALRQAGWPVAGADLGDLPPLAGVVRDQQLAKYATIMHSLREMGYLAVGLGPAECAYGVYAVLDQYAAVKEQPPYLLAGNVMGQLAGKPTPRAEAFIGPGRRPMIGLMETARVGTLDVAVVGVIGPSVQKEIEKTLAAAGPAPRVAMAPQETALDEAVAALPRGRSLNVLLYQGSLEEAKQVAARYPQFHVLLCRSPDGTAAATPLPPNPKDAPPRWIVQTGWKGQSVAVLAVFAGPNGTYDIRVQIVPLGEPWTTPGPDDVAAQKNPVLHLLEQYAREVRRRDYLSQFPELPHPAMAKAAQAQLRFVGSEACRQCHPAEYAAWKESRHSHAYETLEHHARRPSLRQFDGECLVCHTVGLGYQSGFRSAERTPHLKHVGCESCHGPGSGHAADPKNPQLLALQSPWRGSSDERLPDVATFPALARLSAADRDKAPLTPPQRRAIAAVANMCMNCHDSENDPHFDLVTYWPKVYHGKGDTNKTPTPR